MPRTQPQSKREKECVSERPLTSSLVSCCFGLPHFLSSALCFSLEDGDVVLLRYLLRLQVYHSLLGLPPKHSLCEIEHRGEHLRFCQVWLGDTAAKRRALPRKA